MGAATVAEAMKSIPPATTASFAIFILVPFSSRLVEVETQKHLALTAYIFNMYGI